MHQCQLRGKVSALSPDLPVGECLQRVATIWPALTVRDHRTLQRSCKEVFGGQAVTLSLVIARTFPPRSLFLVPNDGPDDAKCSRGPTCVSDGAHMGSFRLLRCDSIRSAPPRRPASFPYLYLPSFFLSFSRHERICECEIRTIICAMGCPVSTIGNGPPKPPESC